MSVEHETVPLRARIARWLIRGTGWAVAPLEATDPMVTACISNSLALMRREGVTALYPDDPPPRPKQVARSGFRAMMEAAP